MCTCDNSPKTYIQCLFINSVLLPTATTNIRCNVVIIYCGKTYFCLMVCVVVSCGYWQVVFVKIQRIYIILNYKYFFLFLTYLLWDKIDLQQNLLLNLSAKKF